MQVTFVKNFKFLKNLEVDILMLIVNTGKSSPASIFQMNGKSNILGATASISPLFEKWLH